MNLESSITALKNSILHIQNGNINNRLNPEKFRKIIKQYYPTSHQKHLRFCAVTLILFNINHVTFSIFIKRPSYNGYHSNQFALPGGKKEKNDTTLAQTAIRETYEELGIKILPCEIIGMLDPIIIPVSNFLVFPYVVFLNNPPKIIPNKFEVEKVFQFPVSELLLPATEIKTEINIHQNSIIVPAYKVQNQIIWGATAMMLFDFINRIENLNSGV
jgi:8-oxo-dGTP pyrophosphatase MutT (NUDIX family)